MFQRLLEKLTRPEPEPAETSARETIQIVRAEVEAAAQETLDRIDEALTAWRSLEQRRERQAGIRESWQDKAEQAVREMASAQKGGRVQDHQRWRSLARAALQKLAVAERELESLDAVIAQTEPRIKEALLVVEQAGLSKERALSQIDSLQASLATAEAQELLASKLLAEQASSVQQAVAQAASAVSEVASRAAAKHELAGAFRYDDELQRIVDQVKLQGG